MKAKKLRRQRSKKLRNLARLVYWQEDVQVEKSWQRMSDHIKQGFMNLFNSTSRSEAMSACQAYTLAKVYGRRAEDLSDAVNYAMLHHKLEAELAAKGALIKLWQDKPIKPLER